MSRTAAELEVEAAKALDQLMGQGYSARHPDMLSAYIQAKRKKLNGGVFIIDTDQESEDP